MPHHKISPFLSGKSIVVVVNPNSARGKWKRNPRLREYFERLFPGRVYDQTIGKADMVEQAKRLSLENDVIVIVGGDGTLSDVMQGVIDSGRRNEVVMGIIPYGSGNAVRKSLFIPKAVKPALRTFFRGAPRTIDLIDIGGRVASFVSIGATGMVTHRKVQTKIPGLAGHLLASTSLLTCPREPMEIDLFDGRDDKGRSFDRKTLNLKLFDCVVNKTNHFGYGWVVAPKARIDDGYLDVTLFDIRSYNYLLNFPLIYIGRYQQYLKHFKARRMIIRGLMLHAQYNGEILERRHELELKVIPRAVRVIGPK